MFHYGHLFRILHSCASQVVTNTLAAMDLTASQGHILGYIAHCPQPPCPKDLEEYFQLSHPTVSGILARLEKKDFIELCTDPGDRRCRRIYIRPKGLECDEMIRDAIVLNEAQIVQGFSDEEKTVFAKLLIRAAENLGGDPRLCCQKEESDQ